jgi:hypothetical protein
VTETRSESTFERWISFGTRIVAPTTLLSTLLFYYGYVSSRSQYQYFGLDVDTIGLGTQDYIMRSPQPLLVPLLALILVGAGLLLLHSSIQSRIATSINPIETASDEHDQQRQAGRTRGVEHIRLVSRVWAIVGCVILGAGVAVLLMYSFLGDWPPYSLATPLLIATGATLTAYASRVLRLVRQPAERSSSATTDNAAASSPAERSTSQGRAVGVLLCVVIVASIFWATATVAQWSGRGIAQYEARNFNRLPSVILDTKERLFLRSPGIEETTLLMSEGQTFRYRYRHLRLLIVGHDRMFLVPDRWSASNSTLIVHLGDSVRVQFQFQNDPP